MFIRQVVSHVFLGNPEVGMYVARSNHPGSNVYVKNANHLCWDGYSPSIHNIVVLDNFIADPHTGDVTAGYLLQLATGMPIELNQLNSGRHIPASFTTLIITTSVPFENWFDNWIRVDPNTRRLLAKCLSIVIVTYPNSVMRPSSRMCPQLIIVKGFCRWNQKHYRMTE